MPCPGSAAWSWQCFKGSLLHWKRQGTCTGVPPETLLPSSLGIGFPACLFCGLPLLAAVFPLHNVPEQQSVMTASPACVFFPRAAILAGTVSSLLPSSGKQSKCTFCPCRPHPPFLTQRKAHSFPCTPLQCKWLAASREMRSFMLTKLADSPAIRFCHAVSGAKYDT